MNRRALWSLFAVVGLAAMTGCATVPKDPVALATYRANHDPLEPFNRKMFAFNQKVDKFVLKPAARTYVKVIPAPGRTGIFNFLSNLKEPMVLGNNILQLKFKRAGTTLSRFVLNSTIGILGIFDFASKHGLKRQTGDFGQTLWTYGVHEGPYLVVPVFGPTTPRDGIGEGVDIVLDPFFYVDRHADYRTTVSVTRVVLSGIDLRAQNLDVLDELQRESVDFYAAMRSLYRQNRVAELNNGVAPPQPKADDLYSDPDGPDPGSTTAPPSVAPAGVSTSAPTTAPSSPPAAPAPTPPDPAAPTPQ